MRDINHLIEHLKKSVETGEPFFPQEHDIEMLQRYNTSAEAEDRHYIKIYADDEPSVKAEKLYQICGETQNGEVTEWLKEYFPSADAVPQSEQYKKGFEDAKRAFELEFAREAESIRKRNAELEVMLNMQKELSAKAEWIPLSHDDDGMGTDFPYVCDGEWVIVTDGNTISVERIKKDVYDHFYPNGRWFELDDVIAWMPLPKPYREDGEE